MSTTKSPAACQRTPTSCTRKSLTMFWVTMFLKRIIVNIIKWTLLRLIMKRCSNFQILLPVPEITLYLTIQLGKFEDVRIHWILYDDSNVWISIWINWTNCYTHWTGRKRFIETTFDMFKWILKHLFNVLEPRNFIICLPWEDEINLKKEDKSPW